MASHTFFLTIVKIKVDPFDYLPTEKRLTMHNVIIRIKSVLNEDKNQYDYKVFS